MTYVKGVIKVKTFGDFLKPEAVKKKGTVIQASTGPEPVGESISGRFNIEKSDDDKRLAFGWANVAFDETGEQIEDYQRDIVTAEVLEKAAYEFVELYREGGEMHERGDCAVLVESIMFTLEKQKALGIPEGTLPEGWWVGFHVTDDDVWKSVKDGTYPMFSIGGTAKRVIVEE